MEQMLATIIGLAQDKGVEFGTIQVIDSVHTIADVNTAKDDSRKKRGKPPRDGDAAWGVKHTKRERDEQGKTVERRQYFHGYKAHVSMNTGSDLITTVGVTPGNAYDGHRLPELVESDLRKELPLAEFIPLPPHARERRKPVGQYGQLQVFLFDLYSTALSKIARGFEADLEDVMFLLHGKLIEFEELQRHFHSVLPEAHKADIIPGELSEYFQEIARRYKTTE